MAQKVKKTKTALKSQRDQLGRFLRYLPTLELKKQQLRIEVHRQEVALEKNRQEYQKLTQELEQWVQLFSEQVAWDEMLLAPTIEFDLANIAGINVPVLARLEFNRGRIDLFDTPPWVDDGIEMLEKLIRVDLEYQAISRARDLLAEELRVTSQRVNLFEKVKIPAAKEHIRVIKIALGDAQTAAVSRAKLSKNKLERAEANGS